jgi:hypothetical protein
MGGMFSVLKVRRDQKPGDYANPPWYQNPPGTVASEFGGPMAEPERSGQGGDASMPRNRQPAEPAEVQVRKPVDHNDH